MSVSRSDSRDNGKEKTCSGKVFKRCPLKTTILGTRPFYCSDLYH